MIRTILKNIGCNSNESSIYITCLSLNKCPISTLSKKSWIKRTSLYVMVGKMLKDWLLTSFERDWIKYYSAVDPEVITERLKQKGHMMLDNANQFELLIPALRNIHWSSNEVSVRYFEWFEGMKNLFQDVVNDNEKVYAILAIHRMSKRVIKYFEDDYTVQRRNKIIYSSNIIVLDDLSSTSYMYNNYKKW